MIYEIDILPDQMNFTKFNPLEGYRILNTILPKYFQTKFPYSAMNEGKLTFTRKKVEILAKTAPPPAAKTKPAPIKGGSTNTITIYC